MAGAVVGDYGDVILINVGYDFTGYTDLTVYITKPDLTVLTKTYSGADPITDNGDPSAGVIKYTVEDGDLDIDGTYLISAMVTSSSGDYSGPTPAEYVVRRRNQET